MSRNQREGRYFGKMNGRPKRVPAHCRTPEYRAKYGRALFNFGFHRVA